MRAVIAHDVAVATSNDGASRGTLTIAGGTNRFLFLNNGNQINSTGAVWMTASAAGLNVGLLAPKSPSSQVTNVNDLRVASRSAVTCWVKLVKYCARRGVTSGAFSPRLTGC